MSNKISASYMSAERASQDVERKEVQESIFIGAATTGRMTLIEKSYDKRIIILLIISPVWTLLFTAVPVVITFHGIAADIYRFAEPVVSLPISYFILTSAEVFTDQNHEEALVFKNLSERSFLNIWFLIGAALYAQGAAMHATAIIAKHNIENLITTYPNITTQYPAVNDSYVYFQETLEHTIGHYLYAFGAVLITWAQLFAYRHQRHYNLHSKVSLFGWILGGILYSFLLAGVAIEFPKGTIVGLAYVLVVGVPLALYLLKDKSLFSRGKRLVLQSYLLGYVVAFVIIVIWIIIVGGFKDRKSTGLFAKG
ncbi:12754_t:CDS:2 [Acaulospora colombiana]|uniref:12754_t:CDS:1 n=1 Tax=Acaulospora colombiana TaxID=27376 RepID=A0ACA9JXE6_9GLOM|nr:12754_t:CDS:2 [Acaulospora colombiana]